MNREIKFRAWQPHHSLYREPGMYDVTGVEFYKEHGGGEAWLSNDGIQADTSEFFEDIALMQYTGLKDNNGVEIYEGDIITCVGGYDWPEGNDGCECPHKVIFEEGQWRVGCINGCGGFPLYEFDINEVIGNIYENPELLES